MSPFFVSTFLIEFIFDNNKLGSESVSAVKPEGKFTSIIAMLLLFPPTNLMHKNKYHLFQIHKKNFLRHLNIIKFDEKNQILTMYKRTNEYDFYSNFYLAEDPE